MSSKAPTAENLARAEWSLSRTSAELVELLESFDPETGELPEDFDERLDALSMSANEKMAGLIDGVSTLRMYSKRLKEESNRLRDRSKALESRASRIMDAVGRVLRMMNVRKIETPLLTAWIQNNPPAVEIEDESIIPAEYIEIVQTTRVRRREILEALKAGREVPGCSLRQGESVRWR